MSKWRSTCPDKLLSTIINISDARLYLLRQTGPTGFLIKEHEGELKYKVLLGIVHSCDCNYFLKEKELCKHILWILIRKFRVPKEDPIVFQLGLCERDLNNVLYENRKIPNNDESLPSNTASAGCKKQGLKQKQIEKDDVCPICQDDIYKTKKSLSFCKFGCGNSVHVSCMKIWADHQHKSTNEEVIKCPLCRTEFASYKSILQEHRRSLTKLKMKKNSAKLFCDKCKQQPDDSLTVYRCSTCNTTICRTCFYPPKHYDHQVKIKSGNGEKWQQLKAPEVNLCVGGTSSFSKQENKPNSKLTRLHSLTRGRSSSQIDLRDLNNLSVSGLSLTSSPVVKEITECHRQNEQRTPASRFRLPPIGKNRGLIRKPSSAKTVSQTKLRQNMADLTVFSTSLVLKIPGDS